MMDMKRWLPDTIFWILCLDTCNGQTWTQVNTLHNSLFSGYNPDIRPINTQSDAVKVDVALQLFNIDDYNSVSGVLSLVAALTIVWTDDQLTWTPASNGGLESIVVNQTKIWRPSLYNLKVAEVFRPIGNEHFRASVEYNGKVTWSPGGFFKVKCLPDVNKFPFDQQTCSIDLTPWGYDHTEVLLASTLSYIDLTFYTKSGEFDIKSTSAFSSVESLLSYVQFQLTFKRFPLYHGLNTIFPAILILLLNPLVFILPPESGERVSYSLTVLLSFIVFLTIVNTVLPKVSDPMAALSYFTIISMIISAFIAATTILQLHFFYKADKDPIRKCLLTIYNCLRKKRCKNVKCRKRAITDKQTTETGKVEEDEQTTELENPEENPSWSDFVNTFDKLFLTLFYVMIFLFGFITVVYVGT